MRKLGKKWKKEKCVKHFLCVKKENKYGKKRKNREKNEKHVENGKTMFDKNEKVV